MKRGLSLALALALAMTDAAPSALAQSDDPVVVNVGQTSVRRAELERRLSQLPAYQLRTLGDTPEAIRLRYVQTVLVPELLAVNAARARNLETAPWVRPRVQDALRRVLQNDVHEKALAERPITSKEIAKYYDDNKQHFHADQRIQIWRILVGDADLARKIITEARGVGGPERWSSLSREHSLDTATRLRGGTLGFVRADGSTDVPQVRVDPALYAAALRVKDGEIVPDPVPENGKLAIVWRRGTVPAVTQTLSQQEAGIRQVLERMRTQDALTQLLAQLRKNHLRDYAPEALEALPAPPPSAQAPLRAPDPVAPGSASSNPAPKQSPFGLR